MDRRIRFFAAVLAGCAVLAPAALGDGAAGPPPPPPAAPQPPRPAQAAPLHPGKAGGVRAAEEGQTGLALVGAGGVIIAVIAVTAGSGGGKNAAQPNAQSVVGTTS